VLGHRLRFFLFCVDWCVCCVSTLGDKLGKLGQGVSRVWCVGVLVAWKLQVRAESCDSSYPSIDCTRCIGCILTTR
jgi:hypothetical protein